MRQQKRAFTLVELLVVIAIIAILISLLLPAINSSREAARRSGCANNIAQLSLATSNYELAYGYFPPGVEDESGPIENKGQGHHQGWLGALLPYLEEHVAYKHIDRQLSVYDKSNSGVRTISIRAFTCPSSSAPRLDIGISHYAGVHHDIEAPIDADNNGILFLNSRITRDDITDGSAYTLLIGEKRNDHPIVDLGWLSGTAATLRNTGTPINMTGKNPPGLVSALPVPDQDGYEVYEPGHREIEKDVSQEDDEKSPSDEQSPVTKQVAGEATEKQPTPMVNPALFVGGFGSEHPTGANFVFADGNVRFLQEGTDSRLLRQLGHRSDGQLLDLGQID